MSTTVKTKMAAQFLERKQGGYRLIVIIMWYGSQQGFGI